MVDSWLKVVVASCCLISILILNCS
uniref:Uncharacterized protein n=1 Tax=Arundo donax TaxID=35708 RepID=A0A0A8ZH67_ARUDO